MSIRLGVFLACACVVLGGCAGVRPVDGRGRTLAEFLDETRQAQAFPIQALYKPPAPEDYGKLFLLTRSPVALDLAQNATSFTAWRKGLAVGFADGQVRVYGRSSCAGLDAPLPGPVDLLAWGPFSRFLVAADKSRLTAAVVDIETCSVLETLDAGVKVRAAAVSDVGTTVAVLDEAGRLRLGPPTGYLKLVADLPSDFLGMDFTPGEGVLTAVSASGEVVLVDARNGSIMDRFYIEGGPFGGVRFEEHYLALEDRFGMKSAFDLLARRPVPYSRMLDQFFLDGGTLRYRTWTDVLHLASFSGWDGITVAYSPGLDALRVRDVDGAIHYYDAGSGLERPCAQAADWRDVGTNEKGNFCLGERCYILADVAFQWDHDQLLCRWLPGQGYYLWWRKSERPAEYSPLPDHLPQRESILAERPAVWHPVLPPPDFP